MPNNVTNVFDFKKELTNEELEVIKKELYTVYEGKLTLDFNKIIQQPKRLIRVPIGPDTVEAYTYYYKKNPDNLTQEEFEEVFLKNNFKQNGKIVNGEYIEEIYKNLSNKEKELVKNLKRVDDWYHWNIENWGTKWNSYNNSLNNDCIVFSTAWDMPSDEIIIHIFETLRKVMTDEEIKNIDYSIDDEGDDCVQHFSYDVEDKNFQLKYEEEKIYEYY